MSTKARRSEALIKKDLLVGDLPASLLQHSCEISRSPCGGCPNDLACRNCFT